MTQYPPLNLDPKATPWGKAIQRELEALKTDFKRYKDSQGNAGRAGSSTMATLSGQVASLTQTTQQLTSVTTSLSGVTTTLSAVANVQYAEWVSSTGSTLGTSGWLVAPASVRVTSPTGRLEVGFGGSLNSGNGTFAYQIVGDSSGTIVNRTDVRNNMAQRASLSGGASFTPSIFNTVILSVPKNEPLTVTAQLYSESATTYFYGARILARVAP